MDWIFYSLRALGRLVYRFPFYVIGLICKIPEKILVLKLPFPKLKIKWQPRPGLRWRTVFSFFLLIGLGLSFYLVILKDLPGPEKLIERQPVISTKIYDRRGQLLYTVFDGSHNRSLIMLEDIPDHVKQATIAIEDKDFYKHTGFSIAGIVRAIIRNLSQTRLEGGSTITQQLIKNALLTPEKTLKRKLKELILSIEAELIFSKDEILQMYLNEVAYGGTTYGIQEAAQLYFAKNVTDLNLAEATLLAGLPAAPTKYSPFGASPESTLSRQHQVLERMVEDGYINSEQAEEAKKEKIVLAPPVTNIRAPHFVMYIKDLLVQKYGQRVVEQGGLQVITSLDLSIQQTAQEILTQEISKLKALRVGNGAVLVTNPSTGEILAMVGSKDYFNLEEDGNVNVATSLRQPGSAIKIITYALALSNGFTPGTIIPDTPITYYTPGGVPYSPVNYDNRFHGNVTLRTALASSYNVPAVKTLAYFGVNNMVDLGQKMGITTWEDRSRFGLSLTLGGGDVKMTDLTTAYGILANYGLKTDLNPILKITDYKDKVLEEAKPTTSRVLSKEVAYLLSDILSDNRARTPAFGPRSLLVIPDHQVAVKTGTTNDKRDNWTVGYTKDRLVAVWVGNNDNSPMSAVASGITGASPIWNKIMSELLKDQPRHQFEAPDNLIKVAVCSWNGLLPCEGCPTVEEYFVPGTEPKYPCSSEEIKRIKEEQEKKKEDKILEGVSTEE